MWQQYLINGIVAGSALGLLAASFALIYQTARFFHFAHASVYTLAAYLTYACTRLLGFPLPLALAASLVLIALVGWLQYVAVYSPISRRQAGPTSLLLVSLGLMVSLQNVISMIFGDELKTLWDQPVGKGISLGAALITPVQLIIVGCSLTALVSFGAFLVYTRMGILLRAVADNPALASAYGLEPRKVIAAAFAIGSALASVAALLAAFDTGLTPTMGFNALLMAVVAVVVGGVGSIPGALIGGLGIGLIQNLAVVVIPTAWTNSLVFVILIVFLLVRPRGLLGQLPPRR